MDWGKYFRERSLTLERFMDDTCDHKTFLNEIVSVGHKDKEILEVGCGNGTHSIFLSRLGYNVISIDNDEEVLNIARQNNTSFDGRVTFKEADAYNLPFGDNRFAVCFSQGFFEHFDDHNIKKLLKEQLRVSNVVVFSVPTFYYPDQEFGDERLISREDWLKILFEFAVDKADYCCGKGTQAKPSQIYFKLTQ
ncbi:class I SAM-dependent methyltransferase [Chloroflexota bacterium]